MAGLLGLFHRSKEGVETPIEVIPETEANLSTIVDKPAANAAPVDPALSAQIASLQDKLAAAEAREAGIVAAHEAKAKDDKIAGIKASATAFAAKAVTDNKILPAARDGLVDAHTFIGLAAAGLPTEGIDALVGLTAMVDGLPSHSLTSELTPADGTLPDGIKPLAHNAGSEAVTEAKQIALLEGYEAGPAAIAILKGKK